MDCLKLIKNQSVGRVKMSIKFLCGGCNKAIAVHGLTFVPRKRKASGSYKVVNKYLGTVRILIDVFIEAVIGTRYSNPKFLISYLIT